MSDELSPEDLLRKQEAMTQLGSQLPNEKNPDRLQEILAQLAAMGRELETMAAAYEAQCRDMMGGGKAPRGYTEVMLTPAQRSHVRKSTGIDMETVLLEDLSGAIGRTMPMTQPAVIETMALQEARRRAQAEKMEKELRRQLAAACDAIESQGGTEVREKLAELKRDPKFLGGLLQPKNP
jgi:hypothetical protein